MASAHTDTELPQSTDQRDPSTFMRVVREVVARAAALLLDPPLPLVTIIFAFIVLVKTGWSCYICLQQELMIAKAVPHVPTLDPSYQFLDWSPAGEIIAKVLGLLTTRSFIALHTVVLVLGAAALIAVTAYRRGDRAARFVLLALACSSSLTVMVRWLGSYDVFTFIVSSLLVLAMSWQAVLFLSIALGFLHFEQGIFIVLALLFVGPKLSLGRKRQALLTVGGVLLGKLIITVYLAKFGGAAALSRLYFVTHDEPLSAFIAGDLSYLPALIYTLFGAGWVWLSVLTWRVGRTWGQTRRAMIALALLLIPAAVTLDQTRVYSMMAWPVLMTLILVAERRASDQDLHWLAGSGLLGFVLLPVGFVTFEGQFFPALADPTGRMMIGILLAVVGMLLLSVRPKHLGEHP